MKKITAVLAALSLVSLVHSDKPSSLPAAIVNKVVITQEDVRIFWEKMVAQLSETSKVTPEQLAKFFDQMYPSVVAKLVERKATEMAVAASDIAKDPKVQEEIKRKTQNILIAAFLERENEAEMKQLSEKDFRQASETIVAKDGDQISISALAISAKLAPRIVRKMAGISSINEKATEWSKICKQYGEGKPTLDHTMALSDLKGDMKAKLENVKTGDVITIPSENSEQTTLIFIPKREKINGELLRSRTAEFVKEMTEQKVMDRILKNVKIQKFDRSGNPEKEGASASTSESAK